jgi:hypothetical protein
VNAWGQLAVFDEIDVWHAPQPIRLIVGQESINCKLNHSGRLRNASEISHSSLRKTVSLIPPGELHITAVLFRQITDHLITFARENQFI